MQNETAPTFTPATASGNAHASGSAEKGLATTPASASPATTTTPIDNPLVSPITPFDETTSPDVHSSDSHQDTIAAPAPDISHPSLDDYPSVASPMEGGPHDDSAAPTGQNLLSTLGDPSPEVKAAIEGITPSKAPPVEVKLFVGRVPRTTDDLQLRPLFEEFGSVGDIIIIRDKNTGSHKGCAFVRMKSITEADSAVRALNNHKILDQTLGPLQVKYAMNEAERLGVPLENAQPGQDQAKLFVGSLPRHTVEADIAAVFSKFGVVDEVFLMRDDLRVSKGCAFVKFALKEESFHAIANLNGKFTMPGGNRAVEVRFAESKKANQPLQGDDATCANWKEYFTQDGTPYYYHVVSKQTQWDRPADFDLSVRMQQHHVAPNAAGAATHGPPGANVFIFHIPNIWAESNLIQHFSQYGSILSARIATDRNSMRNRGFGFVSYNDPRAANLAVQHLNGYSVAGKRLKVQIKKGEENYVRDNMVHPYAQVGGMAGDVHANTRAQHARGPQMSPVLGMPLGGGTHSGGMVHGKVLGSGVQQPPLGSGYSTLPMGQSIGSGSAVDSLSGGNTSQAGHMNYGSGYGAPLM